MSQNVSKVPSVERHQERSLGVRVHDYCITHVLRPIPSSGAKALDWQFNFLQGNTTSEKWPPGLWDRVAGLVLQGLNPLQQEKLSYQLRQRLAGALAGHTPASVHRELEVWFATPPEVTGSPNRLRWAIRCLRFNRRRDKPMIERLGWQKLKEACDQGLRELAGSRSMSAELIGILERLDHSDLDAVRHYARQGRFPSINAGMKDFFADSKLQALPSHVVYVLTRKLLSLGQLLPQLPSDNEPPRSNEIADLHRALAHFVNVSQDTMDRYEGTAGSYYTYRRSLHTPSFVVKGLLKATLILDGEGKPFIETFETNVHQASPGMARAVEKFSGTWSTKAGTPFMVSCRRSSDGAVESPSRGISRGAPRFTLIQSIIYDHEDGRMRSFTGLTLAAFASGILSAVPTCFERMEDSDGDPIENLGVFAITAEEIPPKVRARLEAMDERWLPYHSTRT